MEITEKAKKWAWLSLRCSVEEDTNTYGQVESVAENPSNIEDGMKLIRQIQYDMFQRFDELIATATEHGKLNKEPYISGLQVWLLLQEVNGDFANTATGRTRAAYLATEPRQGLDGHQRQPYLGLWQTVSTRCPKT